MNLEMGTILEYRWRSKFVSDRFWHTFGIYPLLHTQEVTGSSPVAPTTPQQLTDTDRRVTPVRPPVFLPNRLVSGIRLAYDAGGAL